VIPFLALLERVWGALCVAKVTSSGSKDVGADFGRRFSALSFGAGFGRRFSALPSDTDFRRCVWTLILDTEFRRFSDADFLR
jgi:hypothetical protein